ncbi:penicillin-binding transpeptidase domain-containing protein [Actinophytocola xanthii]|uniref:Penicillin-binding protein n=1 Tax=Actinophytocola xanthii TaxID=1912961 RepID=A0A1Q8CGC7_9PSEU|nr:penicillin-binding transpeptidase domain-containing protein [Actinophytocola xanthii]OLF13370.1 penicillin-binding protein [Actinophytocola xanthii]
MRVPSRRRASAVLAALLLVLPLAGCGLFGDSGPRPEDVADEFLGAFASGETAAAARLTDSPDSARALLDEVRGALEPEKVSARLGTVETNADETTARATFELAWDLGHQRRWSYEGGMELRSRDDTWQVHWSTTVVHPDLAEQQSIALESQQPELAPVLDRDGELLMSPDRVISVLFDRAKAGDAASVAGALATALAGFDRTITRQSILDGSAKTPAGQPYQVVALRSGDYQRVKPRIYELPGVRFTSAPRLLAVDKKLGPALLPGIRKLVEDDLNGKAGWRIYTTDVSGAEVAELYSAAAEPAEAARVTLSRRMQQAAERAIAGEPKASMIVAMRASTGELLAVAQNPLADQQGAIALSGRYPPGSTFKIITAVTAIEGGKVTANQPVGCPATITVDGRVIPNAGRFDKGTVPLHTAFAFSCNTTFAQLSTGLHPSAMTDTARRLGLGADFVMRGATTVTGSVPPATDVVERAEDSIGQGKVVASPLGMALVASTVASGRMPTPTLLAGARTESDTVDPKPVAPAVLTSVRGMMREVQQRTPQLAAFPDLHGKTGTAQFGDGRRSHGWFVGFRGDTAFAVLLTDAGTSAKAVAATARFLGGLGS